MFKISRKAIIIGAMVILLAVTGILNWKYVSQDKAKVEAGSQTQINGDDVQTSNFFATYRTERANNRQQEIAYLDSVISNENTDKETVSEAQQMKLDIVADMETESSVEGLLIAKGFEDVVVTFGEGSANVVVKDKELTQSKVAQILEIITRETDYKATEVRVVPTA